MVDYEFKAQVLNSDLFKLYKLVRKSYFSGRTFGDMTPCKAVETDRWQKKHNANAWHECKLIYSSYYHRKERLQNRIESMLANDNCLFLTLTFNDSVLDSTSAETRRKYIRRYLKEYNVPYVANIDFGAKNGREHYHAVIQCDSVNYENWHQFGAIKGEKVRTCVDSGVKLAKYVSKLTNHAIKETTKRNVALYSR